MTEGTDNNEITPDEIQIQLLEDIWDAIRLHHRPDYTLETLVKLADKSIFQINLTLLVSGVAVTGTLVGGRTFFEGQSDLLAKSEPAFDKVFSPAWREFGSHYPESTEESEEVGGPLRRDAYIHLRDAKVITDPVIIATGWWRGRLSSVDAYNFGELDLD